MPPLRVVWVAVTVMVVVEVIVAVKLVVVLVDVRTNGVNAIGLRETAAMAILSDGCTLLPNMSLTTLTKSSRKEVE